MKYGNVLGLTKEESELSDDDLLKKYLKDCVDDAAKALGKGVNCSCTIERSEDNSPDEDGFYGVVVWRNHELFPYKFTT